MDFTGLRVLLVGDSHTVGAYGSDLIAALTNAGAKTVSTVANVGSKATDYTTGKYASAFNNAVGDGSNFDVVIITLGTNDAAVYGLNQANTSAAINQIAAAAAPVAFYVGPPSFSATAAGCPSTWNSGTAAAPSFPCFNPNLNTTADAVWSAVSPSFNTRAFDSRPATAPFVSQTNIHFGADGYQAWSDAVSGWLLQTVPSVTGAALTDAGIDSAAQAQGIGGGGGIAILIGLGLAAAFFLKKK